MRALLALLLLLAPPAVAGDGARSWEVGGVRLEEGQLERLAEEMAERTLAAVDAQVEGIDLRDEQRQRMREIYARVSQDVFERVVDVFQNDGLDEDRKQARAKELVLDGQQQSSRELEAVLDPAQLERYRAWEAQQVQAFQSRRFEAQRRRRRR